MPSNELFQKWILHAGVPDSRAWTPTKELYAAWRGWVERAGGRPGSVGWFASQLRAAGVSPHRTKKAHGWRFALVDVNEIAEKIAAAIKDTGRARQKAHAAGDAGAKAAAVREQLMAQRRAGAFLEENPSSDLAVKIGQAMSKICIRLAQLSDEKFAAKVEAVASQAVAVLSAPPSPCSRTKTIISPWVVGDDGALTRTLTAVDDDGATAAAGAES